VAALSEIEKLEARWAENPDGRYFAPLADAYRKAGRVEDAIMVVGQGLTKHPDYLSAHIVLGRCHLEKKDDVAALLAFEKVLGLDAENIIALKSLAEIAERQSRTEDARRWLQRLLIVDAMNTEAADDLARLGGPIEGEAVPDEAPAAEESGSGISFADLAPEPVAPEPVAAAPAPPVARVSVPIMDPSLMQLANEQTLHIPRPSAQAAPTVPMPAIDIEPTAFEPPPTSRTSEVAPAIDFLGAEPKPVGRVSWSGAPEVGDVDLNKPPAPGGPRLTLGTGGAPVEINLDADLEMPAPMPAVTSQAPGDLPLIMPEDVTPAAEMRRPSMKQVQMVSPEPTLDGESGEPLLTETMGDLYLKQGFKDKAADVYRRLLGARPGDTMLKAKLAALESPQQALSAAAQGTEAVGAWFKRIARSSLGLAAPLPVAAPPAPEPGPSPMDQAFAASEPEPAPPPRVEAEPAPSTPTGAPARPGTDAFTLDRIFGGKRPSGATAAPKAEAPAGPSSFDEFFGEVKQESARPQEGAAGAPSEEDLSAFTTWLHGLKR
jgi:hypothetical protein